MSHITTELVEKIAAARVNAHAEHYSNLDTLRKRAELPNALHGCTSNPCGSVVCQTARDRDELLSRLEQAEQAVARVREMAEEMGEGKAFGILTRGREDEYPISYFIEMLEEALDGEQE